MAAWVHALMGLIPGARVSGAAAAAIDAGARYVGVAVGPILGAVGNIITSEITYGANRAVTNQVPEPSRALEAYYAGQLSWPDTKRCLANMNISVDGNSDPAGNFWTYCWDQIVSLEQPKLDVSTILDLWRKHQFTTDRAFDYLGLHGLTRPGDRQKLMVNRGWPDIGTSTDYWRQGLMSDEQYEKRIDEAGIGDDDAAEIMLSQRSVAPLPTYEQWWLSGWITDDDYRNRLRREAISTPADQDRLLRMRTPIDISQTRTDFWLRRVPEDETWRRMDLLGYGRQPEREVILGSEAPFGAADCLSLWYRGELTRDELRGNLAAQGIVGDQRFNKWFQGSRPIPGAADIISFAVHEAWDPAVVQRLQYDAEFPPELDYWMAKQGWQWGEDENGKPNCPPNQVDWPVAYWRAHWRPITENMANEMFHRLRPGRMARYQEQVPGVDQFKLDDYDLSLKILDYSPTNRKWIEAISFAVLPVYTVRLLYKRNKRTRQWLVDTMMDRGYVRDDAEAIADAEDARLAWDAQAITRSAAAKAQKEAVKQIERGFTLGTLTREYAASKLHDLGMEEETAVAYLDILAARENLSVVEDSIKRLRKAYLDGEFAPVELTARLSALGLMPDAIQRYVARWTIQRTQSRRMLSSEKITHYVATGKMTASVAMARLANLGWTSPDALLMVDEARHKATELEAKAAKAEDMERGKRQRELESVRKKAQKVVTDAEAALRKATPVSMLKRLVCEAIVSPGWAGERLKAMGYDDDTVDLYVKDWASQNAANKKCLPPKDDGEAGATQTVSPPEAVTASGKMTLGGQAIPVGGLPQSITVQPVGKQGNP